MIPASSMACALIARPSFEGCRLKPYVCPAGYWTIGIGSRFLADGSEVNAHTPAITHETALSLLANTVAVDYKALRDMVIVPLTDHQTAALLSWMYNVGIANARSSTLVRVLNQKKYLAAADQLLVWDKDHVDGKLVTVDGLLNRRRIERQYYLTADTPASV